MKVPNRYPIPNPKLKLNQGDPGSSLISLISNQFLSSTGECTVLSSETRELLSDGTTVGLASFIDEIEIVVVTSGGG